MLRNLLLCLLLFNITSAIAQEDDFENLSKTPKDTSINFPLDYKISKPRLGFPTWNQDYDIYYHFITPTIRKTQAILSSNDNGVITNLIPNSVIPLAQLDTLTIVDDPQKLIGTWRMIQFRSIRYEDSVYVPTKTYYRLDDTLLNDKSNDEAFAVFTEDNFKLYAKESGKAKFKKMMSANYQIENKRFMMVYKLAKSGAGVSEFGIDEKGYLILNYPQVIEYVKKGVYISYYAIIEQYIFERVN
jgi:hypothetical protein